MDQEKFYSEPAGMSEEELKQATFKKLAELQEQLAENRIYLRDIRICVVFLFGFVIFSILSLLLYFSSYAAGG